MERPRKTFKKVLDFCELDMTRQFRWYLDNTPLKNMNFKWKEGLNPQQKSMLKNIITEDRFKALLDD